MVELCGWMCLDNWVRGVELNGELEPNLLVMLIRRFDI